MVRIKRCGRLDEGSIPSQGSSFSFFVKTKYLCSCDFFFARMYVSLLKFGTLPMDGRYSFWVANKIGLQAIFLRHDAVFFFFFFFEHLPTCAAFKVSKVNFYQALAQPNIG